MARMYIVVPSMEVPAPDGSNFVLLRQDQMDRTRWQEIGHFSTETSATFKLERSNPPIPTEANWEALCSIQQGILDYISKPHGYYATSDPGRRSGEFWNGVNTVLLPLAAAVLGLILGWFLYGGTR